MAERLDRVLDIARTTAEYMRIMESAQNRHAEMVGGGYTLLSEYNGVVFGTKATKQFECEFAAWERIPDNKGATIRHYIGDYKSAKRDFAVRAGLIPREGVMEYYVTSDVHGFYTLLCTALTEAGYYDDAEPHKVLIVGDLFDRGREAVELQSLILGLLERDEVILIRGNHEDLFEELVTVDNGLRYEHHLSNGTYSTALKLTRFDKRHAKVSPLAFARTARETPHYKTILPAMIDYYETENYIFTHGWIPCLVDGNGGLAYMNGWREASEQGRRDGSTAWMLCKRCPRSGELLSANETCHLQANPGMGQEALWPARQQPRHLFRQGIAAGLSKPNFRREKGREGLTPRSLHQRRKPRPVRHSSVSEL